MRVRTRNNSVAGDVELWSQWASCSQPTMVKVSSTPAMSVGVRELMVDSVVPNYARRSARGETFFNHMTREVHSVASEGVGYLQTQKTPILCSGINRTAVSERRGNHASALVKANFFLGASEVFAPKILSDRDRGYLITEASTRVRSERGKSEANLWESLAQLDQTFGLQAGLLHEAHNLVKSRTSSSNWKMVSRKLSAAANIWLALRYGLGPLLQDIDALRNAMSKEMLKVVRKTTRASAQTSQELITTTSGGTGLIYTYDVVKRETCTVRAMSLDQYLLTSASELGSFKSLLATPLELIPLSFVADWFVNIGDYYGSLLPSPNVEQLGACMVVTSECSMDVLVGSYTDPTYTWNLVRPTAGNVNISSMYKTRFPQLGGAGLVVKSDFRFRNITRCLDAATLLYAAINGKYLR